MKKAFKFIIYFFTLFSIILITILLFYLFNESILFFKTENLRKFIFGKNWKSSEIGQSFEIFNILFGGLYLSLISCLLSFPISLGISLFVSFYITKKVKKIIIWFINILAGIPSVIYGFFGMIVVLKKIENIFNMSTGESILAGSLILSIMIMPFFISNLVENIEKSKKLYFKDSNTLNVSTEFFIYKIILKELRYSIVISFLMSFARAMGETMAVMMVIGNSPQLKFPNILYRAQTIPSLIALEVGMSEVGSKHYSALFASAFILLIIVTIINIFVFYLKKTWRN